MKDSLVAIDEASFSFYDVPVLNPIPFQNRRYGPYVDTSDYSSCSGQCYEFSLPQDLHIGSNVHRLSPVTVDSDSFFRSASRHERRLGNEEPDQFRLDIVPADDRTLDNTIASVGGGDDGDGYTSFSNLIEVHHANRDDKCFNLPFDWVLGRISEAWQQLCEDTRSKLARLPQRH